MGYYDIRLTRLRWPQEFCNWIKRVTGPLQLEKYSIVCYTSAYDKCVISITWKFNWSFARDPEWSDLMLMWAHLPLFGTLYYLGQWVTVQWFWVPWILVQPKTDRMWCISAHRAIAHVGSKSGRGSVRRATWVPKMDSFHNNSSLSSVEKCQFSLSECWFLIV